MNKIDNFLLYAIIWGLLMIKNIRNKNRRYV